MQGYSREWRRRELGFILDEEDGGWGGAKYIVTAHHAGDQVESVLMKLIRGVHMTRVSGMDYAPPREASSSSSSWPAIARPLLGVSKRTLEGWLVSRGVAWREDGSNAGLKYKRNRVRHLLVPVLEELCGGEEALKARIQAYVEQSSMIREMVRQGMVEAGGEEAAGRVDGLGRRGLSVAWLIGGGSSEAVRCEVLHRFIVARVEGGDADGRGSDGVGYRAVARVMSMMRESSSREWEVPVGGGWVARRAGDLLVCVPRQGRKSTGTVAGDDRVSLSDGRGGRGEENGGRIWSCEDVTLVAESQAWSVTAERVTSAPLEAAGEASASSSSSASAAAAERAGECAVVLFNVAPGSVITVRTRREGDVFWCQGRPREVPLKDYLRSANDSPLVHVCLFPARKNSKLCTSVFLSCAHKLMRFGARHYHPTNHS